MFYLAARGLDWEHIVTFQEQSMYLHCACRCVEGMRVSSVEWKPSRMLSSPHVPWQACIPISRQGDTRYLSALVNQYVHCSVLYCTVLYCTVLYCTVLYCTVLYCNALYCTVLYCMDKIREELFEYILSKLIVSGSCDVLPVQSTHSTISSIVLIPMREKRYTKTLITMPSSHTQLDIRLSDQLKLVAVEDFSAESLLHWLAFNDDDIIIFSVISFGT